MKILEPIQVGNLKLENRLIMAPMRSGMAVEGKVSLDQCRYYQQCAGNGALGLVIVEHNYISRQGQAKEDQNGIADDSYLYGLTHLANAIHYGGSKTFIQINHAGSTAHTSLTGCDVVAPSAVINPSLPGMQMPRELSVAEIEDIEDSFALAAVRAKKAGFDGVEIHAAHGYLLNQFFSPITNKRTDAYSGKTLEGRMLCILETVQKVRRAVGNEYPIAVRLGGCDYSEDGSTIEDAVQACRLLEANGVDLIDITGGMCRYIRRGHNEPGYFKDLSSAIHKEVRIPTILTGGVTDIMQAERLLEDDCADIIGIGRALLKDPDWAKKEMEKIQK